MSDDLVSGVRAGRRRGCPAASLSFGPVRQLLHVTHAVRHHPDRRLGTERRRGLRSYGTALRHRNVQDRWRRQAHAELQQRGIRGQVRAVTGMEHRRAGLLDGGDWSGVRDRDARQHGLPASLQSPPPLPRRQPAAQRPLAADDAVLCGKHAVPSA
jgi:hypothetical protein